MEIMVAGEEELYKILPFYVKCDIINPCGRKGDFNMGLFDFFRKKEKNEVVNDENNKMDFILIHEFTGIDGKPMVEYDYTNTEASFKKLYDTTRLIVRKTPTILPNGEMVYTAAVSWYNQKDKDYTKKDINGPKKKKDEFTGIQLRIDFNKMAEDEGYQKAMMTKLLDKNRVDLYILNGLQDDPKNFEGGLGKPTGNYIGELFVNGHTGEYQKHFYDSIGEASHNMEAQVERRKKYREEQKQLKKEAIEKKMAEIEKIKKELQDLGELE